MNTVTVEAVVKWILLQPDDKLVNFGQCSFDDLCGCVMVQYAKNHFTNLNRKINGVGFTSFNDCNRHELVGAKFFHFIPPRIRSTYEVIKYSELKTWVSSPEFRNYLTK